MISDGCTADRLANQRWNLLHLQVFSVLFFFLLAFLGVIRWEDLHRPTTWRSEGWCSAEKRQLSGYSLSSQLGKEKKQQMTHDDPKLSDFWKGALTEILKPRLSVSLGVCERVRMQNYFDRFSCLAAASRSRSCRLVRPSCWCRSDHIHRCPLHTSLILRRMEGKLSKPQRAFNVSCLCSHTFFYLKKSDRARGHLFQTRDGAHLAFGWVQQSVFALCVHCFLSTSSSGVDSSAWQQYTTINTADTVDTLVLPQASSSLSGFSPLCRRFYPSRTGRRHSASGPHRNRQWT